LQQSHSNRLTIRSLPPFHNRQNKKRLPVGSRLQ
jgi:hypothetical protein